MLTKRQKEILDYIDSYARKHGYAPSLEDIKKHFEDVETDPDMKYMVSTILQDSSSTEEEGLIEVYKRIRPGDPATVENAKQMVKEKYGFKPASTPFERTYRTFSNLDDRYENGVHDLLKFVKFGYS